jgi:hypothetical protein
VHVYLVCLYFASSPKQIYFSPMHFDMFYPEYLIPLHSATTTPLPICVYG